MVRTPINKKRHLIALIFTMLAFIIGILLGSLVARERVEFSTEVAQEQRLEAESIQLQYSYITSLLENENCPGILRALEENLNSLEKARIKLENFIQQDNQKEYQFIKRGYTLAEVRYWLLAKQTAEVCKSDAVSILYFYSDEDNCGDCPPQGTVLSTIKERLGDRVLIFSIDTNLKEEAMVSVLKKSFSVEKLPSIIIGSQKAEGLNSVKEIYPILCDKYQEAPELCDEYER